MKKTLIALMALAGMAVGAEPEIGSLVLTNTTANDVISTAVGTASTDWVEEVITLSGNATVSILTNGTNTYTPTSLTGYAIGDTNVGNGGSYVYSVTFALTEEATSLTLSDISAGFVIQSANGNAQTNNRWATYNWQLTSGIGENVTTLVNYATNDSWSQASGSTGTLTMNLGESGVTLNAGETYTLNLKITGVNNAENVVDTNGGFVHIGTITANVTQIVPEPTTATLSLLALAGLAARRRRK